MQLLQHEDDLFGANRLQSEEDLEIWNRKSNGLVISDITVSAIDMRLLISSTSLEPS